MAQPTQRRTWSVVSILADLRQRVSALERTMLRKANIALSAGQISARRGGGVGTVAIATNTVTDIDVGPFVYNYGMAAGAAAGSIAAPVDGVYFISCGVRWDTGWTGIAIFRVISDVNGTLVTESRSVSEGGSGSQHAMTLATALELQAGEEINVAVFQNSGASQDLFPSFGMPFLSVALLRAT